MPRWEPDTENRFRAAALELFSEIGYEHTTVADIAERAGLTARTFFRYFADKREVLFNGSEHLQKTMVDALTSMPAKASSIEAISSAVISAGLFFNDERRPFARIRNTVIAANKELQERELIKMATLSAALKQALKTRGIDALEASLVAETGIVVFKVAFMQWIEASEQRSYGDIVKDALVRLKEITAR